MGCATPTGVMVAGVVVGCVVAGGVVGGVAAAAARSAPSSAGPGIRATAVAVPPGPPAAATRRTRDPLQWPYARTSIWNTPIGSRARYVDARVRSRTFGVDTDWFVVTKRSDPKVRTFMPGAWGQGRCTGATPQQQGRWHAAARRLQHVPRNLVVADAITSGGVYATPNNSSAFLQPDGRTLVSYNVTARCRRGGPLYGSWFGESSLLGDGIAGGHGGSGMSSLGGSLRTGELFGAAPIRHALKINVWGRYLYHDAATGGKRWPARLADGAAPRTYRGTVRALRMGALVAIRPRVTAAQLGIRTAAGRKLFAAFRDYGAYVVDDAGSDAIGLCVERRAELEFTRRTGRHLNATAALQADVGRMIAAFAVVDDNGPRSIGGAGARRAPLAPPFRAAAAAATSGSPRPASALPRPASALPAGGPGSPSAAVAAGTRAAPAEPSGAPASRGPLVPAPVFWAVVAVATATIGGRLGRRTRRNLSAPRRRRRAA